MSSINLEIPIFGPASGFIAVKAGASRLELNATGSYAGGGLTPSLDEMKRLLSALGADERRPIRIMIRPRGPPEPGSMNSQDFIYHESELDEMERSIRGFCESGHLDEKEGDGFVFGVLRRRFEEHFLEVDSGHCQRLVRAAEPYSCVFHRAFDDIVGSRVADQPDSDFDSHTKQIADVNWMRALEMLIECGFSGILTSGGPGCAIDNIDRTRSIVAEGRKRVEVIVGGGVRSMNVADLIREARLNKGCWVHSSCITDRPADVEDNKREETGNSEHGREDTEAIDALEAQTLVAHLRGG